MVVDARNSAGCFACVISFDLCKCQCQLLSRVRLCNPMDSSLPGSSVHGILQARILEWVAISFSRGSSQSKDRTCVSCSGTKTLTHCQWECRTATLEDSLEVSYKIKYTLTIRCSNHAHYYLLTRAENFCTNFIQGWRFPWWLLQCRRPRSDPWVRKILLPQDSTLGIFPKELENMATQKPIHRCLQQLYSLLPKLKSNQDEWTNKL